MKKILFTATVAVAGALAAATTFHVDAQGGDDTGPGSQERPFATLERARDAVRSLKTSGTFPADGAVVVLNGDFDLADDDRAFLLEAADGGTSATAPVVWSAGSRGARFTGAVRLAAGDFSLVSDEAVLARLRPAARGKVFSCDLKKKGVKKLKKLPAQFVQWKEMELFAGGRDCTIARWPNKGWIEIPKVIDRGVKPVDRKKGEWEVGIRGGVFTYEGDEPARWDVSKGVYMKGFWCHDWASETLRVAKIDVEKREITSEGVHHYGIGNSSKWHKAKRRYYVYNILEELDEPGEWFVDREECVLYFIPVDGRFDDVALALRKTPVVAIRGAENIALKGLEFKYVGECAVSVRGSRGIVLDGLQISYSSQLGAELKDVRDSTVRNCRIWQIGGAGLEVQGGDRKTLTRSGNRVTGNEIHHCARLARIGGPCLRFGGCGNVVDHNYFHDTPYIAGNYSGNEHLFEFNEVECAMMESGDGGGMYTGRDWGSQGNVVRWNYFHHFGSEGVELRRSQGVKPEYEPLKESVMVMGLYLDDCDSGDNIYGNIFFKAGWAMFCGGGRDNKWRCNICIDSTSAAHLDIRGLRRARPGEGTKDGWDLLKKLQNMKWQSPPWSVAYPQLVNVMEQDPKLPIGTEFSNNVSIGCKEFFRVNADTMKVLKARIACVNNVHVGETTKQEAQRLPQSNPAEQDRVTFVSNPELERLAKENPLAVQDSPLFKAVKPNFPRIPVEGIGLRGVAR
jgi:hypothetical protein